MSFVLLCWFPRYQRSYLPTAPNAKNQAANLESLFDPYSPNVGEEEFSELRRDGVLRSSQVRSSTKFAEGSVPMNNLREQPEQVGYRHQNTEDHQAKEDSQPELLKHPGRASSSVLRLPQATDAGPWVTIR